MYNSSTEKILPPDVVCLAQCLAIPMRVDLSYSVRSAVFPLNQVPQTVPEVTLILA